MNETTVSGSIAAGPAVGLGTQRRVQEEDSDDGTKAPDAPKAKEFGLWKNSVLAGAEQRDKKKSKKVAESLDEERGKMSSFRQNIISQQEQVMKNIARDPSLDDAQREYLMMINDPKGIVFRASYSSFPKGQAAREQVLDQISKKYNIDSKHLEQADQMYMMKSLNEQDVIESKSEDRNEMDTPAVQSGLKKMADRHNGENWTIDQLAALGKKLSRPVKDVPSPIKSIRHKDGYTEFSGIDKEILRHKKPNTRKHPTNEKPKVDERDYGAGQRQLNLAEENISEEQLLAKELARRLDLFMKGLDRDLGKKSSDRGIQSKTEPSTGAMREDNKSIGPDKNDPYEKGWRARYDDANPYSKGTKEHQQWQHGKDERESQPNHYDESVETGDESKDDINQIASQLKFLPTTKQPKQYKFVKNGTPGRMPAMTYTVSTQEQPVVTITSDGKETQNVAASDDIIMSGPSKENYVIKSSKFPKLYQGNVGGTVIPEQGPRLVALYTGKKPITFMASWGESMILKPGDYLVKDGDNYYRIAKVEYEQTYNQPGSTGQQDVAEEGKGLWANIHAKQNRIKNGSGEHMRKPGSKGAPTKANFKSASKTESVEETTGDPKFDKMLKDMTGKKVVAKQQKADTKQQSRDAFSSMFGGGNPADSLGIRKKGVSETTGDTSFDSMMGKIVKGARYKGAAADQRADTAYGSMMNNITKNAADVAKPSANSKFEQVYSAVERILLSNNVHWDIDDDILDALKKLKIKASDALMQKLERELINRVSDALQYYDDSDLAEQAVSEDSDPCWKDYKQVGMKKKNGKKVPNCVPKEGVAEDTASVKYGVFSKGGSVGDQKWKNDPIKTFDNKEEAIAFAKHRRAGLSKGEKAYYRMSYVVKPIKNTTEKQVNEHGDPWEDPDYEPYGSGRETRSPEQIAKDRAEHEILSKKLGLSNKRDKDSMIGDMTKMLNHFMGQHSKKKDVDEGLGKSIKRAAQGWGSPQDKPADIVKRNKGYDIDTAKKVRAGIDNAPDHTPQGLQKRVLDRKLKGVAEATGYKSQFPSAAPAIQYAKDKVKTFRDPDDGIEIWSMPDGGCDVVHTSNSNGRNHCIDNRGKKLGTIRPQKQGNK